MSVEFTELPAEFDRVLNRWSPHIAKHESKTKEIYAWKKENIVTNKLENVHGM